MHGRTDAHARMHAHTHTTHGMQCIAPHRNIPHRTATHRNAPQRTWSSCRCWNRTAVATYFPSFLGGAGCTYRRLCQSLAVLAFHENLAPTRCAAIASEVASAARVTSIRQQRAPASCAGNICTASMASGAREGSPVSKFARGAPTSAIPVPLKKPASTRILRKLANMVMG